MGAVVLVITIASPSFAGLFTKKPELVIPDLPSAKEQYGFAVMYQRSLIIPAEPKRRGEILQRCILCHERVIKNFPDDQIYTPLSYVEIADCVAGQSNYKKALQMYTAAMQKYPQNDFLQARCLFYIARCQDRMGNFEYAKQLYKQFLDTYRDSKEPNVQQMLKRAQTAYYQVRERKS